MAINYFNYVLIEQRNRRLRETHLRKLKRRQIRDCQNPFEIPDREFQKIFRFDKQMILYLCDELREDLQPINVVDGLPVHIKILTCMHLLADGGYQRPTGQDHSICIAQTTVSKYLAQFVNAIIRVLMPQWIYFPASEEERRRIALRFQEKFGGIPNVVGAIDCTHIAIFPPPGLNKVQYKNRKGFFSINTQLICDADNRILNISARYPGRVGDSFIFSHSRIRAELIRLHQSHISSYYLIGDSGYALEPWLMTPVLHAPPTSPQHRYTQWHCHARNVIERTNGYLKGIFRCLGHDRVLHYAPIKASKIVYACATLYNIMLNYRIPFEINQPQAQDNVSAPNLTEDNSSTLLRLGQQNRNNLINNFFTCCFFKILFRCLKILFRCLIIVLVVCSSLHIF